MCMEAMSTVFDVGYQTSGQRKNHSSEVREIKLAYVYTGIIVKILGRKTVANKIVLGSSQSA